MIIALIVTTALFIKGFMSNNPVKPIKHEDMENRNF